jgi:hypothetical protein
MLVVSGATAGILVGLTRVFGCALMTQFFLFGVVPLSAVGSDLQLVALIKNFFATRVNHNHGLSGRWWAACGWVV